MGLRGLSLRSVVRHTVLAVAAVQAVTLLALVGVDIYRKRGRRPVDFPRVPPKSVTAGGSEVTVYTYGRDVYRDMLDAIGQAKSRVFFETFIWKGDQTGQAFKDALIAAADRGVKVYVVYDHFANLVVRPSFYDMPVNVAVRRHPLVAPGLRLLRNSGRDHRKLLVVDDLVGFVGGYNIGSLYATDWRDTHARLTGDAVWDLQNTFIDYWNLYASKRDSSLPDLGGHSWHPEIRVYRNTPRNLVYPIRAMYLEALDRAAHHIYMTHAYLIPDSDMLSALIRAARRGVDVRIIIPAASNHIVADWLSRGFYGALLRGGVRLLLYQDAMVHAKTATVDGEWSTIGTANIDRLSLHGNYEVNVEIFNDGVARQLEEIFAVDSTNTVEMTWEQWRARHAMVKFSETVLTPFRPLL